MKRLAWLVFGTFLLTGCGDSPTTPSTNNISGTWVGSLQTPNGLNTVTATFAQSGITLSGAWSSVVAGHPELANTGQFTGTRSNAAISLTLTPSVPTLCPYTFTGNLDSATSMTGTFAAFNCTVAAGGTLTLTKQ